MTRNSSQDKNLFFPDQNFPGFKWGEKSQLSSLYLDHLMIFPQVFSPAHLFKTGKRTETDVPSKLFTHCKILSATIKSHTTR